MIFESPHEVLSTVCEDVQVEHSSIPPWSENVKTVMKSLLKELHASGGVGLAAPQIGYVCRIIVVDQHAGTVKSKPEVMINPKITQRSKKFTEEIEACLSLPGKRYMVPRAKSITVSYTNSWGISTTRFVTGYEARIILHEIDHLNGRTIASRGREVL